MAGMLEGIKVVDFTVNAAGPTACGMLADYGATVIKVEKPGMGADERGFAPLVNGKSIPAAWMNRGKKSVVLDLKDPKAIEIAKKLCKDADVVVEANRPGVMKKLGLDYDTIRAINPSVVYCSITAFGQEGPYCRRGGYDILAQAMSGMMDITGEKDGPPIKHGTALGDYFGGVNAFGCIVTALLYKERTGIGQHIDVSLLQGLIYLNSTIDFMNFGKCITRMGNHHSGLCPYGLFQGNNGESIMLGAPAPKMWTRLCEVIGRPELSDDERFNTVGKRVAIMDEVIDIIETWLKTFDHVEEAAKLLDDAGVPCCKVYTNKDVWNDVHINDQAYLVDVEAPDGYGIDSFRTRNVIAKFSEAPGVIKKAPTPGQHNYEILGALGMTKEEIDEMEAGWAPKPKK